MYVEHVVLDERFPLALLDQLVEGVEDGTVWSDVVEDTSHWVSLALNHHMLHAGFVPVRREGEGKGGREVSGELQLWKCTVSLEVCHDHIRFPH